MAERHTRLHALQRRGGKLCCVRMDMARHIVWTRSRMGKLSVVGSLAGPAALMGVLLHFAVLLLY